MSRALTRRARAPKDVPSRAVWFALGAASIVGAFYLYMQMWAGMFGAGRTIPTPSPSPNPEPLPEPVLAET